MRRLIIWTPILLPAFLILTLFLYSALLQIYKTVEFKSWAPDRTAAIQIETSSLPDLFGPQQDLVLCEENSRFLLATYRSSASSFRFAHVTWVDNRYVYIVLDGAWGELAFDTQSRKRINFKAGEVAVSADLSREYGVPQADAIGWATSGGDLTEHLTLAPARTLLDPIPPPPFR